MMQILLEIRKNEWLRIYRNKLAFWVSLVMLSTVMSIWFEMFRFSKDLRLPEWGLVLPYPFLLPFYMVFFCLLPAAFIATTFRLSCLFVFGCIIISSLFPSIILMISITYNPIANGAGSYLFVLLWICLIPSCLVVVMRAVFDVSIRLWCDFIRKK